MTARLLRFGGRPSGAALLAVAACVAIAFTGAFVTRVSRGTTAPSTGAVVPESRLTGEVVAAQDRAAPPRLRKAASLPALAPAPVKPKRRAKKAKSRPRPAATAATPVRTPAAPPEAEPVATAAPPVATAAP